MTCERCGERPAFHLLIPREPANTSCVAVCAGCHKGLDDDRLNLTVGIPTKDLAWENGRRERHIRQDKAQHVAALHELGLKTRSK